MGKMITGKIDAVTFLSLVLAAALVMVVVAGCAAPTGTSVPDDEDTETTVPDDDVDDDTETTVPDDDVDEDTETTIPDDDVEDDTETTVPDDDVEDDTETTVPDDPDPDEGAGTETDAGDAGVTVEFPASDPPEISFSGVVDEVVRPGALVVSVDGPFTDHVWYLNGSRDHVGLTTDGATATIDTGAIARGTHAVSVIVAEGYSSRFSFVVVDAAVE